MTSKQDLLAWVTDTVAALHAAQLDHWNAVLGARDTEHRATLEELGRAMGIPAQTVRWRIRAARRDTGRKGP